MEDTDLKWRKASYSSNGGGNCAEVADATQHVLVRDTQDRTGPVLRFSPAAWRRFADQVKRSLAADLAGLTFPEKPRGLIRRHAQNFLGAASAGRSGP